MSEMVERVARAIYRDSPGPDGTEIFRDEPWRSCIDAAHAAIAVLRECGWKSPDELIEERADAAAKSERWQDEHG